MEEWAGPDSERLRDDWVCHLFLIHFYVLKRSFFGVDTDIVTVVFIVRSRCERLPQQAKCFYNVTDPKSCECGGIYYINNVT